MRQCWPNWLFCPSSHSFNSSNPLNPRKNTQVLLRVCETCQCRLKNTNTRLSPSNTNFSPKTQAHYSMEMLPTRSSKKILLTAGIVLIVFYLMYRGELSQGTSQGPLSTILSLGSSTETVVDCPKTESMSKKTSMISSVIALKLAQMCLL